MPQRRKDLKDQRFFWISFLMACSQKFCGLVRNYSLFKPNKINKMFEFELNLKTLCLLNVKLHSGEKNQLKLWCEQGLHPKISKLLWFSLMLVLRSTSMLYKFVKGWSCSLGEEIHRKWTKHFNRMEQPLIQPD